MSDTGESAGDAELSSRPTDRTGESEPGIVPSHPEPAERPEQSGQPDGRDPEVWRLVAVADVVMELPAAFPEIVLHESQHPWREVRIPVGLHEGTSIAYAFRSIPTPRPLTHELLTEVLERHGVTIEAVRITGRRGQAFHAEMDTTGPRGRQIVPCRPSDAIALALRQQLPTPVLVAEWIFTSVDEEDTGHPEKTEQPENSEASAEHIGSSTSESGPVVPTTEA
jgi:hypothetical protein